MFHGIFEALAPYAIDVGFVPYLVFLSEGAARHHLRIGAHNASSMQEGEGVPMSNMEYLASLRRMQRNQQSAAHFGRPIDQIASWELQAHQCKMLHTVNPDVLVNFPKCLPVPIAARDSDPRWQAMLTLRHRCPHNLSCWIPQHFRTGLSPAKLGKQLATSCNDSCSAVLVEFRAQLSGC